MDIMKIIKKTTNDERTCDERFWKEVQKEEIKKRQINKDIIIKINVSNMEKYLNEFWVKNNIGSCPIDKQNYFNTLSNIFKILKDFEVKE